MLTMVAGFHTFVHCKLLKSSLCINVKVISFIFIRPGHEYFVMVDEAFIEDEFNLCGLSSVVEHYSRALNILLNCEDSDDEDDDDELDEDMQVPDDNKLI